MSDPVIKSYVVNTFYRFKDNAPTTHSYGPFTQGEARTFRDNLLKDFRDSDGEYKYVSINKIQRYGKIR